jgi:hypothetical protein
MAENVSRGSHAARRGDAKVRIEGQHQRRDLRTTPAASLFDRSAQKFGEPSPLHPYLRTRVPDGFHIGLVTKDGTHDFLLAWCPAAW